jgi:hypothetical protein
VVVKPLAELAADASTHYAHAKAAQHFAEAQRSAYHPSVWRSGPVSFSHPQTQTFSGHVPASGPHEGQGVVGWGWIYAPTGGQHDAAAPKSHANITPQDLGAVLSDGFRQLMDGLADIAQKVDSIQKNQR